MGLFGNDKEQDARLDALEVHVRAMTEAIQMNQLDVAALHILLLGLQAQVDEKISRDSVNVGLFYLLTDSDTDSRAAFILAGGGLPALGPVLAVAIDVRKKNKR